MSSILKLTFPDHKLKKDKGKVENRIGEIRRFFSKEIRSYLYKIATS